MNKLLKNAFLGMLLVISPASVTSLKADPFKNDQQEVFIELIVLQFLMCFSTLQNAFLNIPTPLPGSSSVNQPQNNLPEVDFGQSLVQAGNQVILENSLVYVTYRASSTYGGWRLDGDDWDIVYNAWCWELLGILLYESEYSTDPNVHQAYVHEIEHNWSNPELHPELSHGSHSFQAGDMIFMNGSDHVVIATGNGDEVFSLWNRPDRYLLKISLNELIAIWPSESTPKIHRVPVKRIFTFLQTAKK